MAPSEKFKGPSAKNGCLKKIQRGSNPWGGGGGGGRHNQVRFKTEHFFCNVSIYFFIGSFWLSWAEK